MNEMQVFKNEEFGEMRTVKIEDDVWFVGKDVAEALGYGNPRDALSKHVDDEDKNTVANRDGTSGNPNMTIINESGLYSLILSSKLESAKRFKRWVTSEVIPSIQKHGAYLTPKKIEEALLNPDTIIQLATTLKQEREGRMRLERESEQQKQQLREQEPAVLFAKSVEASHTSILVGELAKLLRQNGVEIGQMRLFKWLRENGYLIKRGSDYNMPTQRSMEMGLFEIKERTINDASGTNKIVRTTKITGKGQTFFINKFLSDKAV